MSVDELAWASASAMPGLACEPTVLRPSGARGHNPCEDHAQRNTKSKQQREDTTLPMAPRA